MGKRSLSVKKYFKNHKSIILQQEQENIMNVEFFEQISQKKNDTRLLRPVSGLTEVDLTLRKI